jgi:hypothetical protein
MRVFCPGCGQQIPIATDERARGLTLECATCDTRWRLIGTDPEPQPEPLPVRVVSDCYAITDSAEDPVLVRRYQPYFFGNMLKGAKIGCLITFAGYAFVASVCAAIIGLVMATSHP